MIRQLLKLVAVLVVIAAAGVLLNPTPEKHRDTIQAELSARSQVAKLLQLGRVAAFFSEYHSFGVGSYTTVNNKVVSIGAFGVVFVREQAVLTEGS